MQINSANINSAGLSSSNKVNVQTQRPLTEQDSSRANTPNNDNLRSEQAQRVERLAVDQQGLALVEARQEQRQAVQNQNSQYQQTIYDQPSQRNQTAVAAYQSIDNAEQRDNIAQVFGVDLFA